MMSARRWAAGVMAAAIVCSCGRFAAADEDDGELKAALRAVVAGNVAAYDREDVDGTMSFIHTKSPDYDSTKAVLPEQFKALDVTSELVGFTYIGHDDEFAVARAKTKTTGQAGSDLVNNTVDAILIFHQEGGAWKLWSEQILGVEIPQ